MNLLSFFRYKIYALALMLAIIFAFSSCFGDEKDTETKVSDDARVASLTFSKNDSIPYLETARFTIKNDLDTGLIFNEDSLPYHTRIDSVFPIFTFNETPSGAILYTQNDTIMLTGKDTIDFSQQPTKLQVFASDGKAQKWYNIYVNVHQVYPDLYVWTKHTNQIYSHEGSTQKAVWFNNQINLFVNSGINNYRYVSTDGNTWQQTPISGLPANNNLKQMLLLNNTLYINTKDALYSSQDAQTWSKFDMSTAPFEMVSLLYTFNDSLWSIVLDKTAGTHHLAHSADAQTWQVSDKTLPADFPISDFAAVTFTSPSGRPRAMLIGGFSASGQMLNTQWNVEWTPYGEYRWSNFSIEKPALGTLAGTSIIWYGGKFLLFGGVDSENKILPEQMLESIDEGLNWLAPNKKVNALPESYTPRTRQTVCVDNDNRIWIIGGQTRTEILSDVHSVRLNCINW